MGKLWVLFLVQIVPMADNLYARTLLKQKGCFRCWVFGVGCSVLGVGCSVLGVQTPKAPHIFSMVFCLTSRC